MGEAQPAGLAVKAQHRLGHGQGDQFRVGQPGRPAAPPRGLQMVIDMHVQCGQEGVQFGRHNLMLDTLPASVNPAIGTTRLALRAGLEGRFLGALRADVPIDGSATAERALEELQLEPVGDGSTSLSHFLRNHGTLDQFREYAALRSGARPAGRRVGSSSRPIDLSAVVPHIARPVSCRGCIACTTCHRGTASVSGQFCGSVMGLWPASVTRPPQWQAGHPAPGPSGAGRVHGGHG
ncbi:hypothetical protein J2Z21_004227 [Streptomyces griseochromogenes]|uniref:Uncharacterized protein n=1 Tax=Streptomyces griseochromogenes TaxID=68214 RepID=A0ABS4LVX2_9ACTN|nr:hypothetical protein [Streptomyces griseochromogenes]